MAHGIHILSLKFHYFIATASEEVSEYKVLSRLRSSRNTILLLHSKHRAKDGDKTSMISSITMTGRVAEIVGYPDYCRNFQRLFSNKKLQYIFALRRFLRKVASTFADILKRHINILTLKNCISTDKLLLFC